MLVENLLVRQDVGLSRVVVIVLLVLFIRTIGKSPEAAENRFSWRDVERIPEITHWSILLRLYDRYLRL